MDINWDVVVYHLTHLAIAYGMAFPIGLDREQETRSAGLRTFPLVALGSCAFMLISRDVLGSSEAHARVMYGIVTGIGFIGGGAILKMSDGHVSGTATAAGIWNTGAIGMAVAWDRFEIALVLAGLNVLTLRVGGFVKSGLRRPGSS